MSPHFQPTLRTTIMKKMNFQKIDPLKLLFVIRWPLIQFSLGTQLSWTIIYTSKYPMGAYQMHQKRLLLLYLNMLKRLCNVIMQLCVSKKIALTEQCLFAHLCFWDSILSLLGMNWLLLQIKITSLWYTRLTKFKKNRSKKTHTFPQFN